ncbi:hypothetical protein [Azospirillum argentinense]
MPSGDIMTVHFNPDLIDDSVHSKSRDLSVSLLDGSVGRVVGERWLECRDPALLESWMARVGAELAGEPDPLGDPPDEPRQSIGRIGRDPPPVAEPAEPSLTKSNQSWGLF